jgi:signal transduction histidine kinase
MSLRKILKLKDSLLFRLTFLYTAAFILLASLGFVVFYYRLHAVTIDRMDDELAADVREYATLATEKGFQAISEKLLEDADAETPSEEFLRLMNVRGDVLVSTDMSAWGDVDRRQALSGAERSRSGYFTQTIRMPGGDSRARTMTARIGPALFLQLGETLDETDEFLDIFRHLLLLLTGTLIMVSTAIGWMLARRALADMEAVSRTAEEITRGAYDRRVGIEGRLMETQRLGTTINTMLDRIQNLLRTMQQINDNIAHDLRSPLARIRGIAEMTVVKDKPIEAYREMAISTIEECDTLIDMINTMLDITEVEAGVNTGKIEWFDLSALVLGACELFRPIAAEKKIDLKSSLPESLPFKGDRKRMQRIVTNLVENAIKYTPAHGTVIVTAGRDQGAVKIDVQDSGPGIPENELPYIFRRFYRCDQSRSQGGVGLGLSLVKAYTESMKGSIRVKSEPNRGSLFTLCFDD